jgi:hypothetical protein
MTEAYLLLLDHFNNDDIYVDHLGRMFVITIDDHKNYVKLPDVNDFITTFVSNKKDKDGK